MNGNFSCGLQLWNTGGATCFVPVMGSSLLQGSAARLSQYEKFVISIWIPEVDEQTNKQKTGWILNKMMLRLGTYYLGLTLNAIFLHFTVLIK